MNFERYYGDLTKIEYVLNDKPMSYSYYPMFYGGRVHDDGISRAIQILYLHGFKFPYITDKELERLAYTGYVELDWKGSPQTIELKPTDRLQFTSG